MSTCVGDGCRREWIHPLPTRLIKYGSGDRYIVYLPGGSNKDPVVESQVVEFARRILEQLTEGSLVRSFGDDEPSLGCVGHIGRRRVGA